MADVGAGDRRGVAPVFSYALTLGITTLLITGLLLAAGTFVDDQRERATHSELQVLGQQLSADIAAADRLVRTDKDGDIEVRRSLPHRVVGSTYTIEMIDDGGGPTQPYLELSTRQPDMTVAVPIASKTDVDANSSARGGAVVVVYDSAQDHLEVRDG